MEQTRRACQRRLANVKTYINFNPSEWNNLYWAYYKYMYVNTSRPCVPLPRKTYQYCIKNHWQQKQTLILVTATSTMFFLNFFRRFLPPSSSTSTEPRKSKRNTVPDAPPPPNGFSLKNGDGSSREMFYNHWFSFIFKIIHF